MLKFAPFFALLYWAGAGQQTSVFAEGPAKVDPYDQSKVPLEVEPPADFKGKKIVLVAGSRSHGPGDHEFFAGTAILMNLLKQTRRRLARHGPRRLAEE